jgi:DNA anti-recombination protein RmuC
LKQQTTSQQFSRLQIDLRDIRDKVEGMSRELEDSVTRRLGNIIGSLGHQQTQAQAINHSKADELIGMVRESLMAQVEEREEFTEFRSLIDAQLATITSICNGLEHILQGLSDDILYRIPPELQQLRISSLVEAMDSKPFRTNG